MFLLTLKKQNGDIELTELFNTPERKEAFKKEALSNNIKGFDEDDSVIATIYELKEIATETWK
jgi:hypothetical protein